MKSIRKITQSYGLRPDDVRRALMVTSGVLYDVDDNCISESEEEKILDYVVNQVRQKRELTDIVVQEIKHLQTQMNKIDSPVSGDVIALCKLFETWRMLQDNHLYEF